MEEDQGRASPPLPSRGAYNIDFDALDDSFNPFSSKTAVRNSPPPVRKTPVNVAESLSESGGGDDLQVSSGTLKEPSETPKKKKTKSSKRASAVIEGEDNDNAASVTGAGEGLQDPPAADVHDKPVKTKKVVKKPKSRPVSKNLEQKSDGQATPEKAHHTDELSESITSAAPAEESSVSTPQDSSIHEDTATKPHPEKPQEQNQEQLENSHQRSQETLSADDASFPQPDRLDDPHIDGPALQTNQAEQHREKSPQEETGSVETLAPPEHTPPPAEKSRRHKEKSSSPAVGEDGEEITPRKERSGKVKKTKTKVKKSKHSAVEGETVDSVDAAPEKGEPELFFNKMADTESAEEENKDSRNSPGVSPQGDAAVAQDPAADGAPVKLKHPASRVLEQQVREDPSPSPARNNFLPNDSEDDFYDAFDSPPLPPVSTTGTTAVAADMEDKDGLQSYSDMNDSCTLFQSHDALGGLAWSQEDSTLLDEGAGEAAFAEDLTLVRTMPDLGPAGDSDMADSHGTESVVKLVQVLKYSQSDWNKLRQELELTFQAQLLAKEKEWGGKLADRDTRLATLEEANKKLRQTNDDMRTVMGEFEKTIGQLQSEKEKTSNASQQSLQDVVKERDQALEDLQSVETAFSDLHRRYEKTKGVVDGFKQNEEVLKKCVQDLQNKMKKTEQKIQVIKEQAEEKLERASEEIEKTKKSSASEIARLEAALRKADLQVQSMESTLEQKVKENKELAAICDELIAKVQ
ncbi:uncharacterized protein LOC143276139 isoform X2 [Babylonia areolata]|uniref:uncharacterized protein LOC143276139 isoform X2 n=1 Tax=Babylonia areolata TaxID=304850 RepID=UPI003FD18CAF